MKKPKIKKRLIYLFFIIAIIAGVFTIYYFVKESTENKYLYVFISLAIYNVSNFFGILLTDKNIKYTFYDFIFSMILLPLYPILKIFGTSQKNIKYNKYEIEHIEMSTTDTKNIDVTDSLPLLMTTKYGDTNQKKMSVRLIVQLIRAEKIDIEASLEMLRTLQSDPHPDIVMYASDALTELEDFFIKKIDSFRGILNTPDNFVSYAKFSKYYVLSGLVGGELRDNLIKNTINTLEEAIIQFPLKTDLIELYITFLEYNKQNPMDYALEKYEEIGSQKLLEKCILLCLKYNNIKKAKELVHDFIDLGYKAEHESLKYLLENQ